MPHFYLSVLNMYKQTYGIEGGREGKTKKKIYIEYR